MRKVWLLALLSICATGPTRADVPAGELYRECTDKSYADFELLCLAYFRGYADGLFFGMGEHGNGIYCPTKPLTVDEMRAEFEGYMRAHQGYRTENAAIVLAGILMHSRPCQKSN